MHSENAIRLGFFFFIFALVALWEFLAPRRGLTTSKKLRWISNLGITFLNPVLVRLLFPVLAVNMSLSTCNMLCFMQFQFCGACTWCIMPTWIMM
jgi:hypothetical protein